MGLSGWCGVGWHGVGCDAWGELVRWIGFRRIEKGWVMGDVVGLEELEPTLRQLAQCGLLEPTLRPSPQMVGRPTSYIGALLR